jgi:hypothetical protein
MQRAFLSFFLLTAGLVGATTGGAAARAMAPADTITVRLPNKATLTLTVRDAAQLRQLHTYQLDSLTKRLAGYITQAELAAKAAQTDQTTMVFYPDKDQPGKNLPEQVRITTRKKPGTNNNSKVEVMLNRKFGVTVNSTDTGGKDITFGDTKSKEQRQAHRDSVRQRAFERKRTSSDLTLDLGLNSLVNQKAPNTAAEVDLRPEGSRYVNIGLDWSSRLGGKRSPLYLTAGPHFAFNNYMLSGNNKWVDVNNRTSVVRETDGRQFEKSKLGTSSINLPVMLRLQLHDKHYKSTFSLAAGGFVGHRIKSWTKLKYTTDGKTYKDKEDGNYNMENFQYGVQGTIGYRSLELFAKYNMNRLFKENAGPDTQVLSFGLRLFGN